jgi:hypothetical protein
MEKHASKLDLFLEKSNYYSKVQFLEIIDKE